MLDPKEGQRSYARRMLGVVTAIPLSNRKGEEIVYHYQEKDIIIITPSHT